MHTTPATLHNPITVIMHTVGGELCFNMGYMQYRTICKEYKTVDIAKNTDKSAVFRYFGREEDVGMEDGDNSSVERDWRSS